MKANNLTIILIFLTILIVASCEKENVIISGLKGTWVEIDTKTDTIIFKTNDQSGTFLLYRGFEIKNGYVLPKIGSGPYSYNIIDDKIKIVDLFSSIAEGNNFYFSFDQGHESFQIGMFSFFETNKAILTFKKIN